MQRFEIRFSSTNTPAYSKPVTALVVEPDKVGPTTGVMLFTHGWSGNRFQHQDQMAWSADRFNLVCISVEFRQSGYDFDPVHGRGCEQPYDAGLYQTLDALGALRHVLHARPHLDQQRLYHYGGSQGGQIAMLSSVYAPRTFAWVYASCPVTHLDTDLQARAGRCFAPHELRARSPLALADRIACPVYLEYGQADRNVPCEPHSVALGRALERTGRLAKRIAYPDAGHDLTPTTTKLEAFQSMSRHIDWRARVAQSHDFAAETRVRIRCGERDLTLDWGRAAHDAELVGWEAASDRDPISPNSATPRGPAVLNQTH